MKLFCFLPLEKMTDKRKLLQMVEDAINRSPDDSEIMAKFVIDATADWFEIVLDSIGIQPSAIPALLRWQAHQDEYVAYETEEI